MRLSEVHVKCPVIFISSLRVEIEVDLLMLGQVRRGRPQGNSRTMGQNYVQMPYPNAKFVCQMPLPKIVLVGYRAVSCS